MSVRGTSSPSREWAKGVCRNLERVLECLLGPDVPLEPLLQAAQLRALDAWPPPADEPLSVWLRCIATAVALAHLTSGAPRWRVRPPSPRPGSVREVLSHLYARLRGMPPQEQLAFALLELDGASVNEAAAVLRVAPTTLLQRVVRVRRQLLFAARRDRLLLRYLCIARRLRAMAQHQAGVSTSLAHAPSWG
jgi:DNA-directed RNA polymerase specialized sigma24 family protein